MSEDAPDKPEAEPVQWVPHAKVLPRRPSVFDTRGAIFRDCTFEEESALDPTWLGVRRIYLDDEERAE